MAEVQSIHNWQQKLGDSFLGQELALSDCFAQSSSLHQLEHEIEIGIFEHFKQLDNVHVRNFTENLDFFKQVAQIHLFHVLGIDDFDGHFFSRFDI